MQICCTVGQVWLGQALASISVYDYTLNTG